MKFPRPLLTPALTIPFLVAFGTLPEAPKFAPAEGLSVKKSIVAKTDLSLDKMEMTVNGQAVPFEMTMDSTVNVITTVTDVYGGVADGRPTKLTRTFDALSSKTDASVSNPMTGDQDMNSSGSSDLEGETVVFTWDGDADDYKVAFAEGSDGDADLLEGLTEDLDFRTILPPNDVSAGDTWTVDPNAIRAVLAPGGNVKLTPDDESGEMGMGGGGPMSTAQFLQNLEGDVTAKFTGVEDDDGAKIAVIELDIDVSSAMDLTSWFSDLMEKQEMPEGIDVQIDVESFDSEYLFEGKGELRWNMTTGIVHSLEVTGDVTQSNDTAMKMSFNGTDQNMEQSMEFSGTQTITLTTE